MFLFSSRAIISPAYTRAHFSIPQVSLGAEIICMITNHFPLSWQESLGNTKAKKKVTLPQAIHIYNAITLDAHHRPRTISVFLPHNAKNLNNRYTLIYKKYRFSFGLINRYPWFLYSFLSFIFKFISSFSLSPIFGLRKRENTTSCPTTITFIRSHTLTLHQTR